MKKFLLFLLILFISQFSYASDPTQLLITVCPSGCDYSNLSSAVAHLVSSHSNLVTENKYCDIQISGTWESEDTTPIQITNITTDSTHYINIYTTGNAKNNGTYSGYRLHNSTNGDQPINITGSGLYVTIDGLAIKLTADGYTNRSAIRSGENISQYLTIKNNVIVGDLGSGWVEGEAGIRISGISGSALIYNNIIYGFIKSGEGIATNSGIVFENYASFIGNIYNNTIYGNDYGIKCGGNGTMTFKNNLANGNTIDYSVTADTATTNLSEDATSPNTALRSKAVTFANEGGKDFQLSAADTNAKGAGTYLGTIFQTDINSLIRGGTWDIGADQVASTASPPVTTSFELNPLSKSLTVGLSWSTYTDFPITHYLVKESATTPTVSDPLWSETKPTSYTFSTTGNKTLYGWIKNENSDISEVASDTTTIVADNTFFVWPTTNISKIRPKDAPDGTAYGTGITARSAKNQTIGMQFIITALAEQLTNVDVSVSINGLPSNAETTIYKVAPIYVFDWSKSYGHPILSTDQNPMDTGEWPEILLPKVDPFYNENRSIFPFSESNISRSYEYHNISMGNQGPGYGVPLFTPSIAPPSGFVWPNNGHNGGYWFMPHPNNMGNGGVSTSGVYTGGSSKRYIIQITSYGALGTAQYKWSDDNGVTFTEGVTTSASPTLLNNGVYVTFSGNTREDDFMGGDNAKMIGFISGDSYYNGKGGTYFGTACTSSSGGVGKLITMPYVTCEGSCQSPITTTGTAIIYVTSGTFNSGDVVTIGSYHITLSNTRETRTVSDEWVFDVSPNRNIPIWVDLWVPPETVAGDYTGTITVSATGKTSVEIPVSLHVYNFSIPSTATLHNEIHRGPLCMGYAFGGDCETTWANKLFSATLLRNKLSQDTLPEYPSVTCQSYNEGTGAITINETTLDSWFDAWVLNESGNGTSVIDPIYGVKFHGGLSSISDMGYAWPTGSLWGMSAGSCSYTNATLLNSRMWGKFMDYLEDKGIYDRFWVYLIDEPANWDRSGFGELKSRSDAWRAADPRIPIMVTTNLNFKDWVQSNYSYDLGDAVDIFMYSGDFQSGLRYSECMSVSGASESCCSDYDTQPIYDEWCPAATSPNYVSWLAESNPATRRMGNCFSGSSYKGPSWAIDARATQNMIGPIFGYYYDLPTLLIAASNENFWADYYTQAIETWDVNYYFASNGDMAWLYPGVPTGTSSSYTKYRIGGTKPIFLESLRLKFARQGFDDYEYLHILDGQGKESWAKTKLATLITRYDSFSSTASDWVTLRDDLAKEIEGTTQEATADTTVMSVGNGSIFKGLGNNHTIKNLKFQNVQ